MKGRWPSASSPPHLPVSRSAVSQHLKVLKGAGLVSERAAGTRRIYRLNEAAVVALRDQLDTFWDRALSGFQDLVEQPPGGEEMTRPMMPQSTERSSSTHRSNLPLPRLSNASATSSRPSTTCSARRSPRPASSREVGGHIYDSAADGSECRWARVLAYEPPDRVVFSWDISPQWQLETDERNTSEVEVRFVAETPDRTASRARTPSPRSPRPWLGVVCERRRQRWGMAALPGPLRGPRRRGSLMPPISASIEVARSAEDVFAYATDPSRFSEWQKGVVSGRMDSDGAPRSGTAV